MDRIKECFYRVSVFFLDDTKPFDKRLEDFIMFMSQEFAVKRCSLMLIDYNDMSIEVSASTNPKIVGMKRKLSDVAISTVTLLEEEALWLDSIDRSYFQSLNNSKYESPFSLSIPVKYFDKKLGVVNLTDFQDVQTFVNRDIEIVKELVKLVSPMIYAEIARVSCSDYTKRLEAKNNQLIELDRMKTELINFIVHDLKGPISVVIANLDMLLYDNLTDQQSDLVTLAYEATQNLQRMVLNILDVQKLEEARINILREECDMYEVVKEQVHSCKSILKRKNIEVLIHGESTPCYIDPDLIGRTIANILFNAIEHSPENSKITISISKEKNQDVVVSIEDMAGGIPENLIDRIFDKYFQVLEEGRAYSKTSTGLGLTFCKLIVEAHGGSINVRNTQNGANFTITLPQKIVLS